MTVEMVCNWASEHRHSCYFLMNGQLLYKHVVDGHKAAIALTKDQSHMLLYRTAAPFQNMPVKGARLLRTHVLVDKSPPWEEWRPWAGQVEPGWFFSGDLPAARESSSSRATYRASCDA